VQSDNQTYTTLNPYFTVSTSSAAYTENRTPSRRTCRRSKVDRSGPNDDHPVVKALYEAIDWVLRPIVAGGECR
jgi:hypothetical protein